MGLRMDDLHAPTVPSGPTTLPPSTSQENLSLEALMTLKGKLEAELSALSSVLDSHKVNMTTPLTTPDDFPRSDLDIAQIRTTRARIIHLKTDYKSVMSRIEAGLHARHAAYQASNPAGDSTSTSTSTNPSSSAADPAARGLAETPFAVVNSVAAGSPAETAGLKPGDKIRRVGDATWMNHEDLKRVGEVVRRGEGRGVLVRVSRAKGEQVSGGDEELDLNLVPRSGWGGRGLLGCHIVPI